MKTINITIYWLGCLYVITNILLLNEWQIFFDPLSQTTVLIPTILAIFLYQGKNINQRLKLSLKVCWFSGLLLFLSGVIGVFSSTLNDSEIDARSIFAGLSVTLLPLLYCTVISLFYAPYLIDMDNKEMK